MDVNLKHGRASFADGEIVRKSCAVPCRTIMARGYFRLPVRCCPNPTTRAAMRSTSLTSRAVSEEDVPGLAPAAFSAVSCWTILVMYVSVASEGAVMVVSLRKRAWR